MKNKPSISDLMSSPNNLEALIRGIYNLNYLEYIVLVSLFQLKEADVEMIMEHTGQTWHKNKVNGALISLMEQNLCTRTPIQTEGRGKARFLYRPKPLENVVTETKKRIKEWVDHVSERLNDLVAFVHDVDTKEYQKRKQKRERIRKEWFNNGKAKDS